MGQPQGRSRKLWRLWWLRLLKRLTRAGVPDYTVFTVLSIITGAAAGIITILFHECIQGLEFASHWLREHFYELGLFIFMAIPAFGMALQALMIQQSPKTAKNRGILAVIKSVATRGGYLPIKTTIFHFIAPIICIGTGGTVGPEGPTAQIGAGVSSFLGKSLGLSESKKKMFTTAGAGAAIAAIFNTPLGGIFFALELILLNDFRAPVFSALVLASVTASIISRSILGDTPTFIFDTINLQYDQIYLFIILGIGAGIISLAFVRYSDAIGRLIKKAQKKVPQWSIMTAVGALVGLCGYLYPQIMGIGYDAINEVLSTEITWQSVLVLFVLKFILVPLTLRSGGFGGIFAPSLVLGAAYGFAFTYMADHFLGLDIQYTPYILVGMGAVLGAINSIPISAILIIFEMTKDYSFILPLMLGVVISTTIVQLRLKSSVINRELEEAGLRIPNGQDTNILRSLFVRNVMRKEVMLIPETMPLAELVRQFIKHPHHLFFTVDKEGNYTGSILESELRSVLLDYDKMQYQLIAADVARPENLIVRPDDDLETVMNLFAKESTDGFPVVAPDCQGQVIGCISRQDVMKAYNRESIKYNLAEGFAADLKSINEQSSYSIADGYSITECAIPDHFVGKSMYDLHVRNRFKIEVLMVKHAPSPFSEASGAPSFTVPDARYQFRAGDKVVIFGKDVNLKALKDKGH